MRSGIKCPECNSCLDVIWIMPRRFYHCWLCKEFYDKVDGVVVVVDVESIVPITKEKLEQMLENYYEKSS